MSPGVAGHPGVASLPSRGAWIEIPSPRRSSRGCRVAPLAGSVDRNGELAGEADAAIQVAPLAGSVDRNADDSLAETESGAVAPLAGSVDRNKDYLAKRLIMKGVAPLAGSVDRNLYPSAAGRERTSRSPRGERG